MSRRLAVFIMFLIMALMSIPLTAPAADSCAEKLGQNRASPVFAVLPGTMTLDAKKWDYLPRFEFTEKSYGAQFSNYFLRVFDPRGVEVGMTQFMVDHAKKALFVTYIKTDPNLRQRGLSIEIIAQVLLKFPKTMMIDGTLGETNAEVLYAKTLEGSTIEEAFWLSPGGKACARYGFTKLLSIQDVGFLEHQFHFQAARPGFIP